MPHLMLNFEATRDVQKTDGQLVPTGKESIAFKIIDIDKGKVVELSADASNVKQIERAPTFAESHVASQVLAREPGRNVDKATHDRIVAERDSYREKHTSSQVTINRQRDELTTAHNRITEMKAKLKDFDEDGKLLLGAALDQYIEVLASTQQFIEGALKDFDWKIDWNYSLDHHRDIPDIDFDFSRVTSGWQYYSAALLSLEEMMQLREIWRVELDMRAIGKKLKEFARRKRRSKKINQISKQQWRAEERRRSKQRLPGR